MSINEDLFEEFKVRLADKFTAEELVELLQLDVWQIIEMFQDEILELDRDVVK